MVTEVIMKRELFGSLISQKSQSEFFSATDLINAGNKWRIANGYTYFNMTQYLNQVKTKEFIAEIESKYGKSVIKGKGRSSATWVHPLVFIDIALAINPKLKVEVYEWLFDNLIRFRNDSGDSYKEMCAALFLRNSNNREFQNLIQAIASQIKQSLGVKDWQLASEQQLRKRDLIHNSIKLLCKVLKNTDDIVRISIVENLK